MSAGISGKAVNLIANVATIDTDLALNIVNNGSYQSYNETFK